MATTLLDRHHTILLGALMTLTACANNPAEPEVASSTQLQPLPRTVYQVNDTLNFIDQVSGETVSWSVTEQDGDNITIVDQANCSWTSSGDPMRPSITWKNCGDGAWATGGTQSAKIKGEIWPMQVGKKITYSQYFFNSAGEKSGQRHSRKCRVKSTVSVAVGETLMDAYKLTCNQDYADKLNRTYWFAPEVGLIKRRVGSSTNPKEQLERVL